MAYSITTEDGITIDNIPDNVDPNSNELKARVAKIRASGGEETGVFYTIAATNGTNTCMYKSTTEIVPLATRKASVTFDGPCSLGGKNATEVTVTPWLYDSNHEAKLCPNSNKYTVS